MSTDSSSEPSMLCHGPTSGDPSALVLLPGPGSVLSLTGGSSTTAAAPCAPRPPASAAPCRAPS
eukprot:8956749-Pyramimonas_sp.AAC.1